jgi:alanyl-tRNA synthetase
MTERLYHADPYCREFDATIHSVDGRDGRTLVTLDRTAFYPTSGGQPFDVGTLGPHRVVDVSDEADGTIVHVLDLLDRPQPGAASPRAGQTVRGTIDWPRRFDHMQQHSGQHVLSAALDRLYAARTVSFHLGTASSTIDLARELSREEIAIAETEANRIVWDDRPVTIRFVSAEEAAALPLRKEPTREGTLRVVEIAGFDLSACGGTHVAQTGAIGVIAVGALERFKGGQRMEFLCGGRALGRFRTMRDTLGGAVRLLSVLPDEVPGAIERLQTEARERQRALSSLRQDLARYRADELAASAEHAGAGFLVLRAVDADANGLKSLAAAVVTKPGRTVVLVSTTRPALVVAARSKDGSMSASQMVGALTAKFGGRGGGTPDFAQAGGLDGNADDILAAARSVIVGGVS